MMPRICHSALAILVTSCLGIAQLPSTKLFMLDMKINEVRVVLENPQYLSEFNPDGYNNQPAFVNENEVLITSDWQAQGLTDIYRLNLENKQISRVTATEESEYSPTPSADGESILVVRQEVSDIEPVPQLLWEYPADQSNFGESVIDDLANIGYFRYLDENHVALFMVGTSNMLVIYDLEAKKDQFIARNIGRTLKMVPGKGLYYLQNIGNTAAVRLYDTESKLSRLVTYTPSGTQDFEILPNGDLVAGHEAVLFRYQLEGSKEWEPVMDLAPAGIKNITRIAASKDKLIFVDGG